MRDEDGLPVVIRNAPLLEDGTPMPTRYWLVGKQARLAVDHLEAAGGVRAAEAAIDPEELVLAHARYAAERDSALPTGWDGPRPSGGVGGTRKGVKCLHAHYASWLAGSDDPVGRWVAERLGNGLPWMPALSVGGVGAGAPAGTDPVPSAPVPSAPVPSAPVPGAPVPSASAPSVGFAAGGERASLDGERDERGGHIG